MRAAIFGVMLGLANSLFFGFAPTVSAAQSITRQTAYVYGADGLLIKEIIEPASSKLCEVSEHGYDAYGNRISRTVRNCNGTTVNGVAEAAAPSGTSSFAAFDSRTTTIAYDASKRFVATSTDALGHTDTLTLAALTGAPLTATDANGETVTRQYDGLGRKTLEIQPDNNKTSWEYLYCSGVNGGTQSCPMIGDFEGAVKIVATPLSSTNQVNGPIHEIFTDAWGREIESSLVDEIGRRTSVSTEYDHSGRIVRKSLPKFATHKWVDFTYDALDRVRTETQPDGGVTSFNYSGFVMNTFDALFGFSGVTKDSQGQVIEVSDGNQQTLVHEYDPYGNLLKTTDAAGNVTHHTYDVRGRRTFTHDPDAGNRTYQYNALGELVKQVDANGLATQFVYDKLGRMTSRTESGLTSTWVYDTCQDGIGRLCQAQTDNGTQRSYTYDTYGRPASISMVLDTTYSAGVTYDSNGRVQTRTYPTGFALKYVYTQGGFLKEIRNNATNALFWSADLADVHAGGQLGKYKYGNGIVTTNTFDENTNRLNQRVAGIGTSTSVQNLGFTYDLAGNMLSRQDVTQGVAETFVYDNLHRLTTVNTQGGGVTGIATVNVAYNAIGNITSKTGVGTYAYNPSGSTSVRPRAVASITGALSTTYTYDSQGNMLTGMGRTVTYTSFNQPISISKGSNVLSYVYDDTHRRVKETGPNGTTYYVHPDNAGGLLYEKEVKTGVTEHRHFINTPSGVAAVYTQRSTNVDTLRYLHKDHLGSVSVVTNESGSVIERLAYDPWGKRQYPNGTVDTAGILAGANTDRGFTEHQHLDEVGLIHMNGRIYDPAVGRFFSPDPFVQATNSMPSWNRYSYAANNPLNFVDPSGYFLGGLIDSLFNAVGDVIKETRRTVRSAIRDLPPPVAQLGSVILSFQCGPTFAAVCAGVFTYEVSKAYGASSGRAFRGALAAAFMTEGMKWAGGQGAADSPTRYAAHGGVGCVGGMLAGGGCARGAASAVAGKWITNLATGSVEVKFAMATVAGGTASVIGGGKFMNGATTAAFGYLYNQLLTQEQAQARADALNRYIMAGRGCGAGAANQCAGIRGGVPQPLTDEQKATAAALASAGSSGAGLAAPFLVPPANFIAAGGSILLNGASYYFDPPTPVRAAVDVINFSVPFSAGFAPDTYRPAVEFTGTLLLEQYRAKTESILRSMSSGQ